MRLTSLLLDVRAAMSPTHPKLYQMKPSYFFPCFTTFKTNRNHINLAYGEFTQRKVFSEPKVINVSTLLPIQSLQGGQHTSRNQINVVFGRFTCRRVSRTPELISDEAVSSFSLSRLRKMNTQMETGYNVILCGFIHKQISVTARVISDEVVS